MTTYVETDYLLALAKDSDWLKDRAEEELEEYDVVTSTYSYLEILLIEERHEFDYIKLFSNMLEVVPVETDEERQIVLKAVNYFDDGMTAFDSFHAATAETRGHPILNSDKAYENVDSERLPLEPTEEN
ncbi:MULTISPECIES: PIN domain-containing protein [Halorubrum]|uniref:Twitching motility protein PilT n=1 Tax=Halorubrum tropicale TaxID=1765655 RepID=A0A0M9AJL4_9EURY|nr:MULTISPECIES: PIN domain-containing protein [Halorubrum]KOX93322.1 twitching motility protein PilT [Halorubrum tropicale]TKX43836.1 PIN domain-containing protein [Halorubrum sp. ARQ200]